MDNILRQIMEAGSFAPSGENAQPWRFRVNGDVIELYMNPDSDESLYNYGGFGTYTSMGACLENLCIASRALGRSPELKFFPDPDNSNYVASVDVSKSMSDITTADKTMNAAIKDRATNRKPFSRSKLNSAQLEALNSIATDLESSGLSLNRITDRRQIEALAKVASTNERIMLGNIELHNFFFNHLTWTKAEDEKRRSGFYIKTLELPTPVQALFKILKYWSVMKVLKYFSFPVLVGKGNAQTYEAASEYGVIRIPKIEPLHFVKAGMLFERIWLTATATGVELQPLTGIIFMNFFAESDRSNILSSSEIQIISESIQELYNQVGSEGGKIALMYRIGLAGRPTARALKFDLEKLLL